MQGQLRKSKKISKSKIFLFHITVKSLKFMGKKLRGLTKMDVFVHLNSWLSMYTKYC